MPRISRNTNDCEPLKRPYDIAKYGEMENQKKQR